MVKRYAFLWHVDVEAMTVSDGVGGYSIESAETSMETESEAIEKLIKWLEAQTKNCSNANCEHTPSIEEELAPKIVMSGMTQGMVKL